MKRYEVLYDSRLDEYKVIYHEFEGMYYEAQISFGHKEDALFYARARNEEGQ